MADELSRSLFQGSPEDLRFQFKVIEGLSESIRQQSASTERLASGMAEMQKTQVSMLERLATLEAGKVTARLDAMDAKIDILFKDKDRRDGALGMLGMLRVWGPSLFGLFIAMYLLGRSMGLVPSPPTTVTKIETPVAIEQRREAAERATETRNVH